MSNEGGDVGACWGMPAVNVSLSTPTPEEDDSTSEESLAKFELGLFCKNITMALDRLKPKGEYDDSSNAFLYIVFVLMFYACSIVILMIKYIRREREGVKLEYYYDEFVKREAFQYRLFDKTGRLLPLPSDPSSVPNLLAPQPGTSGQRQHSSRNASGGRRGSTSSSSGEEDIQSVVPTKKVRVYNETNV